MLVQKLLALLIMLIPAAIAVFGIKLMRDTLYLLFNPTLPFQWAKFILGLILFVLPVLFIGGFILHHDRKRNRVQPRFMLPEQEDEE
ncbi:DUF2627 domain-containing protein [Brevibacillus fulvus]|uniref:DUF2627 domain-containing protein n=1 Tax=Brevibacillus fulvus TaxID=1125967 RepID=A0A938XVR9_9BACL|nr:DUF2627 domain-containing protein [Brevibacillus fulvus]MBM7588605.1 hypothetical protein [Brevibacillus fulvus]